MYTCKSGGLRSNQDGLIFLLLFLRVRYIIVLTDVVGDRNHCLIFEFRIDMPHSNSFEDSPKLFVGVNFFGVNIVSHGSMPDEWALRNEATSKV